MEMKNLLEEILKVLHPGETVAKGIQRLGGSASRKRGTTTRVRPSGEQPPPADTAEDRIQTDDAAEQPEDEKMAPLDRLISLADQMVALGVYEVYQDSYEKLAYKLRSLEPTPALDMFADEVEEKKLAAKEGNEVWAAGGGASFSGRSSDPLFFLQQCGRRMLFCGSINGRIRTGPSCTARSPAPRCR